MTYELLMVNRLTVLTALIAFFGIAVSFVTQTTAPLPGSAFASVGGGDCKYLAGVVCTLERQDDFASEDRGANF